MSQSQENPNDAVPEKKGWLQNLLRVRTLEPSKESHSMQLSSKETVYEIQCEYISSFFPLTL